MSPEAVRAAVAEQFRRLNRDVADAGARAALSNFERQTLANFDDQLKRYPDRPVFPVDVQYVAESYAKVVRPRFEKAFDIVSHSCPVKVGGIAAGLDV